MKSKAELTELINRIASADSPVGMDAVYVHALILDKLEQIEMRLDRLESAATWYVSDSPASGEAADNGSPSEPQV